MQDSLLQLAISLVHYNGLVHKFDLLNARDDGDTRSDREVTHEVDNIQLRIPVQLFRKALDTYFRNEKPHLFQKYRTRLETMEQDAESPEHANHYLDWRGPIFEVYKRGTA